MSRTSAPELYGLLSIGRNQSVLQNFFSNIPFSIWFVIGCVIAVLAVQKFKQAAARPEGTVPAPRDVRKAGKEGKWNKLNEHHTSRLRGKREDMATDPQIRLLAPSMVYLLRNDEIVNRLKLSDPAGMRGVPGRGWGITDRKGLIRQIYSLLHAEHREDFAALRERCARSGWVDTRITRLSKTTDSSTEDWERRWCIRHFLDNDRGIQSLDSTAWDLIRATDLTRTSAGLGWLSEDEAWDTLAAINQVSQSSYSSWEGTWEAFHITHWLWAAEGNTQTANNDLRDRDRGELLVGKNGLQTTILWNAPYLVPHFILLDVLRKVDVLHLLSSSSWGDASMQEGDLDARARTRVPMPIGGKATVN